MTEIIHLDGLYERNAGKNLLDQLARIYPEGRVRHYFTADLPIHDKRVNDLLGILQRLNWRPWNCVDPIDDGREFSMRIERDYNANDLESFDYLELFPLDPTSFSGMYRDEVTGQVELDVSKLSKKSDFSLARVERYVASDRAVGALQASRLRHLLFQPTLLCDERKRAAGEIAPRIAWEDSKHFPWYEIWSDFSLPQVSPSMTLTDFWGKPMDSSNQDARHCRIEGLYAMPELHYRASDMKKLKPFDLAHTYECFGGDPRWKERTLVASKRFYQVCKAHDLKVGWLPVRIDPD